MDKNIKQRLIAKLRKGKIDLEELSSEVDINKRELRVYLKELKDSGVQLLSTTSYIDKKQLFYVPILPDIGNVFFISGDDRKQHTMHFAATSDIHFGSVFHLPKTFNEALKKTEDVGIKDVFIAGDIVDGFGIYKGHHENLITPSIEGQTDIAAETFSKYPNLRFWADAGNHDYSYTQQNGAKPLSILEAKLDNFHNLGDFRADVIMNGIRIRLLHGAGNRAYARSYPSQQYLRDYFGGLEREQLTEVPHIIIIGHYHTYYQGKDHGIHILQCGSFQDGDNEYCVRRGLTGPAGLFHVELDHHSGIIDEFRTNYIQPTIASKEKGSMFAKTTKNYKR